jgi:hypothetical protein
MPYHLRSRFRPRTSFPLRRRLHLSIVSRHLRSIAAGPVVSFLVRRAVRVRRGAYAYIAGRTAASFGCAGRSSVRCWRRSWGDTAGRGSTESARAPQGGGPVRPASSGGVELPDFAGRRGQDLCCLWVGKRAASCWERLVDVSEAEWCIAQLARSIGVQS